MKDKIERKDFRPAVRFAQWKIRRQEAKQEREANVKSIKATLEDNIKGIKDDADFKVRMEEAKADDAIARENDKLNSTLLAIAEEQADFEAELRNYIANIPEEERKALAFLEEGGAR